MCRTPSVENCMEESWKKDLWSNQLMRRFSILVENAERVGHPVTLSVENYIEESSWKRDLLSNQMTWSFSLLVKNAERVGYPVTLSGKLHWGNFMEEGFLIKSSDVKFFSPCGKCRTCRTPYHPRWKIALRKFHERGISDQINWREVWDVAIQQTMAQTGQEK